MNDKSLGGEDSTAPILKESHDGIQEYDNPLPAWWLWTFLGTIIFAFHYWIHYESGSGMTQNEELARDMKEIHSHQQQRPAPTESEEDFQKLAGVASVLNQGRDIYLAKCAVCHGSDLQGSIGPNLTDEYWIHGKGHLLDIAQVVRTGALDKGMPSWEGQLQADEIRAVVVLIASKKGSQPAGAKPPQGDKVAN